MMYTHVLNLLHSESGSDFVTEVIRYAPIFKKSSQKRLLGKKALGEFVFQKELGEGKKNYYRVTRAQFAEFLGLIKDTYKLRV